ncbi:MAG: YqiJ family protein [Pseudomonadota bacterium]|nr:YqiJ family protein [Pseudomonadota bacterium]
MTLLEAYNLPFLVALVALVFISLAQIVGLGDLFDSGDAEIDFDVDADAANSSGFVEGAFSLLGLGRVPFLIWLMLLLFVFSAIGVGGQATAVALFGAPLHTALAGVLAGIAALPVNGVLTRPLARLLPQDETSAVSLDSLVRRDAEIQIGTAKRGSPARSKVLDIFGHPHFVMVEPHDPDAALGEGETVLLVRREGETFFAVRYESPLLSVD